MKKALILVISLVAMAIMLGGCTSTTPAVTPTALPTPQPTAQPGPISTTPGATLTPVFKSVTIKGFAFDPAVVEIPVGGTVTWTNEDDTPHIVKFSDAQSISLHKSDMFSRYFGDKGQYDYVCGIHSSMKGTVKVV